MIEGVVELGQHTCAVQDGQLMIYVPGGEGGSEPLDDTTIRRLEFLLGLAMAHHAQEVNGA